ncbi:hypothetical protein D3C76_1812390 [compost metagenome]
MPATKRATTIAESVEAKAATKLPRVNTRAVTSMTFFLDQLAVSAVRIGAENVAPNA